jgi:hypothetical protein
VENQQLHLRVNGSIEILLKFKAGHKVSWMDAAKMLFPIFQTIWIRLIKEWVESLP